MANFVTKLKANFVATKIRYVDGVKPTINRVNKGEAWGVSVTDNFIRVDRGNRVQYFPKTVSPFHNLYRIESRPTEDFVIHKVIPGHHTVVTGE